MKRSTWILLLVVVVLALIYLVADRTLRRSPIAEAADFAVRDTSEVDRIFLADRRGGSVLLTRQSPTSWMVNNQFPADAMKIRLLMETLRTMEVRNPVGEKEFNSVVADLAANAVKVELYHDDDLMRTVYVGQATPDGTGTYMINEGSGTPYIIHVRGFVGYLTPRFMTSAYRWKSKLVFDLPADSIRSVKVTYHDAPGLSYSISQQNGQIQLIAANGQPLPVNKSFAAYYLSSFKDMYLESWADDLETAVRDSILGVPPFCLLTLEDHQGVLKELKLYRKPVDQHTKQQTDEKGNPLPFDQEKFLAQINGDSVLGYVQEFNFGKLLRTADAFIDKGNP